MLKSYFFLNRQITEIRKDLIGKIIKSVFTQEKEKLVVEISDDENVFVEFCVNHSLPYFVIRDLYIRARKNSLELFDYLKEKVINDILIADNDRIVAFSFNDGSVLFFTIRGKFTNVYLKTNDEFISFKKTESEDLTQIESDLVNKNFINEFKEPEFSEEDYHLNAEQLRQKYPFIGKEIIQYTKVFQSNNLVDGIKKVLELMKKNNPVVIVDYFNYEINISFRGLQTESEHFKFFEFEKLNDAILFFIKEKHILSSVKEKKEIILRHIEKELKRISNKQNNLITIIERGSRDEEYKNYGNLLLINIDKIHQGSNSIKLKDISDNDRLVEIKLDPKLSPKENINRYFEKAKESKTQYQKAKELIQVISKEKEKLIELKNKTDLAFSLKELEQIAKTLRIKMKQENKTQDTITEKFKHYIIDGKYKVYVGKDSKSNDLLTLKFAKQNDYWFHARAVPGSHVILRVVNAKEPVPKSVLKKAASIAAFHSKAKTAGVVPVSYTLKKFVVKRKGMEPGKVALLKEDTLLVSPEIPDGVEFIENPI